jgi:hypothetical protein
MTYGQARNLLHGKSKAKITGNTYLESCDTGGRRETDGDIASCIAIRYHNTQIIRMRPDGTYQLFTRGYDTVTTLRRLNSYTPARLFKDDGILYVGTNSVRTEVANDPLRKIIDDINEFGDRTLPLAVKWTSGGTDQVTDAWNASRDFGVMLEFLARFSKGFRKIKRLITNSEITIPDAFDMIRKTKAPTASGVLKKLTARVYHHHIYLPSGIGQRVKFYDGIIVDREGREVKP